MEQITPTYVRHLREKRREAEEAVYRARAEEYRLYLLRDRTAHGVVAAMRAAEAVVELERLATNARIEAITAQGILDTQSFPPFQKVVDRGQ